MNGVQTRFKCKLDVKRCKRFVFPPSSLLPRSNALKTKAIRYFQTDRTLTRIVSPPLYGNWLCVAAAYNAGQGRISTQLQKQMVSQAADLWLVEETSRYMFRLLAAKAVISNPQRYGFLLKREHLYPAIPYTEVTVTTGIDNLAQFAKNKGITYAQLKDANPWLRDTSLMNKSGRTYILKIPTQAGMHYDPRKTIPYNKNWVIN